MRSFHSSPITVRGSSSAAAGGPEDAELPYEVQVLWFPSRASYDTYLADDRRRVLFDRFGDVFVRKEAVVDVIDGLRDSQ
jgi:hypothetical protein